MFLLNSRLEHFSATVFLVNTAILLPKLRIYFAEFLNEGSHKHLRILIPPTCVGLRYCWLTVMPNEAFLGNWGQQLVPEPKFCTFVLIFTLVPPGFTKATGCLIQRHPSAVLPTLLRHSTALLLSSGVLTGFPSTTALALALGTD